MHIRARHILFLLLITSICARGQIQINAPLPSEKWKAQQKIEQYDLQAQGELIEDSEAKPSSKPGPLKFARTYKVLLTPDNSGIIKKTPDGGRLWMLAIKSDSAYSLNLTFGDYRIPDGARLFVRDPSKNNIAGAFTSLNNKKSGSLNIRPIPGDKVIIEYYEPGDASFEGDLKITRIGHDYKNQFSAEKIEAAGECHVNINCSLGDGWQFEKRAVTKIIVDNTDICTGALINNTNSDGTPYLLTANHCINTAHEAENTLFFFNYESETCQGSTGSLSQSVSGASLVATAPDDNQDFALVELSKKPPADFSPYYAGWSRSDSPPESGITIHHPSGDIKKISKDNDAPITGDYGSGYDENTHWQILEWDYGATEGGSSGAPLFDENHRIIGDLTGGEASCDNPVNDYFAKFSEAWDSYDSNDEQLEHWLDPLGNNPMAINGYDPYAASYDIDVKLLEVKKPKSEICNNDSVIPYIKFQNTGNNTIDTLNIVYNLDNNEPDTVTWSGNLNTNQADSLSLPELGFNLGEHNFMVKLCSPNNKTDQDTSDNTINKAFTSLKGNPYSLLLNTDSYGYETSWKIENDANEVIYEGGDYTSNSRISEDLCLSTGCYTFTITDKAGDGMCCEAGDGSFHLINEQTGDTVYSGGDFDAFKEVDFCVNDTIPDYDAELYKILHPEKIVCKSKDLTPKVIIKNYGKETIDYAKIHYRFDENTWNEVMLEKSMQTKQFDTISFDKINPPEGAHNFEAKIEMTNNTDGNEKNDSQTKNFRVVNGKTVTFQLRTDKYGSEIIWEITKNDTVMHAGGPYKDDLIQNIKREFCLETGCYEFTIYDAANDGICCGWTGDGHYILENQTTGDTLAEGGEYESRDNKSFCVYPVSTPKRETERNIEINPNPAAKYVRVDFNNSRENTIILYNTAGVKLKEKTTSGKSQRINVGQYKPGLYIIHIRGKDYVVSRKLLIK